MNRTNYLRLILSITPGDIYRIPCSSEREYKSNRMLFYRALAQAKTEAKSGQGAFSSMSLENITTRKTIEEKEIFLEILNPVPGTSIILKKDSTGKFFPTTLPAVTPAEDAEFESWVAGVTREKII